MRDPACKQGPAYVVTSKSDPRPVSTMRGPASTRGTASNRNNEVIFFISLLRDS